MCASVSSDGHWSPNLWTVAVWTHSLTPSLVGVPVGGTKSALLYEEAFRSVITPIYSAGSSINTQLHTSLHLRVTLGGGHKTLNDLFSSGGNADVRR